MATNAKSPTDAELKVALGSAYRLWTGILRAVEDMVSPLRTEWRPSKSGFGRMCLLRHRKRTLLYLTPERGAITVAIVLGARAYRLAMASSLPAAIKRVCSEAKPYAEGRGIRFAVGSATDIAAIRTLVTIKISPDEDLAGATTTGQR